VTGRVGATRRLRQAGAPGAGADQWDAPRDVLRLPDVRRLELAWGPSLIGFVASTITLFVYAFDLAAVTSNRISARAAEDLADERLAATSR